MKLLQKDFTVNQTGTAKIVAEEPDDVWLLYNLIVPGDVVSADTTRKVHLESATKKNSTSSRVKLTLHLKVTSHDFHKDSSTLRLHGRNLQQNQHVAAGSFHTLTLEPNKPFQLKKKLWENDALQTLNENSKSNNDNNNNNNNNSNSSSDLAVVLFHNNHAEIHRIGQQGGSTLCGKIEQKKTGSAGGALFFKQVFAALIKHVDFKVVKNVVVTSEEFRRFVSSEAKRLKTPAVRVVVVSGHEGDLGRVLGDRAVMDLVKDGRVGAFRELWEMVCNDSDRACYGREEVERAREMRAIETLLITDELYRNDDVGTRKMYDGLVKNVKEGGGKALVYSSEHVSASQLAQLTGVAAILRFPLPQLELEHENEC